MEGKISKRREWVKWVRFETWVSKILLGMHFLLKMDRAFWLGLALLKRQKKNKKRKKEKRGNAKKRKGNMGWKCIRDGEERGRE